MARWLCWFPSSRRMHMTSSQCSPQTPHTDRERCNVTPPATLREKVPWMEGSIWTACSGVAMRSVQDPVVPQH